MKTISVAYKLKALRRVARQGRIWGEEMSRSNQEQRKILSFARRHGDAAASEAYEVSRRTLRRWRKLARTRGEAFLGDCRGGRSGRRSGRKADRRQVEFIRAFRADRRRARRHAGQPADRPGSPRAGQAAQAAPQPRTPPAQEDERPAPRRFSRLGYGGNPAGGGRHPAVSIHRGGSPLALGFRHGVPQAQRPMRRRVPAPVAVGPARPRPRPALRQRG